MKQFIRWIVSSDIFGEDKIIYAFAGICYKIYVNYSLKLFSNK